MTTADPLLRQFFDGFHYLIDDHVRSLLHGKPEAARFVNFTYMPKREPAPDRQQKVIEEDMRTTP